MATKRVACGRWPAVVAVLGLLIPGAAAAAPSALQADAPKRCDNCAAWNAPQEPFRVFGNTYYVGPAGLSAILIASDRGLILLDGGLPQSAPLIDASIRKLGFRTEDVRLIVNSHAHFDHAGGIAALARASGATVAASASGARAIEDGGPPADDPQFGFGAAANGFPAVKPVKVVADGETLRVGPLAITAHLTPGHTPGSTTWTWRSCEGARCLQIVYADSLNAVSAPGFRFSGDGTHPGLEATFRRSIAAVAALPCDVLLAVHPGFAGMEEKLRRRRERPASGSGADPFVDPGACRAYARDAERRLDERIAQENADELKAPAASAPRARDEQIRTELYFGLSIKGGKKVSPGQWDAFLRDEVTPRFPMGFTILDARGQWKDEHGRIGREKSKMLILLHDDDPESAAKIEAIRDAYKRRFAQESVLRSNQPASVAF